VEQRSEQHFQVAVGLRDDLSMKERQEFISREHIRVGSRQITNCEGIRIKQTPRKQTAGAAQHNQLVCQPAHLVDLMANLADSQPEKVKELAKRWQAWAARANVLPLDGWRGKPTAKKKSK
jgi:hypothetical protein